jgi:hypothetical protein
MAVDHIGYADMVQTALHGVLVRVLERAASKERLPSPHHVFITFDTTFPGVTLPLRLRQQYPEEMTIVLQSHYWDLEVSSERFSVTLTFQQQPERLGIPLAAVSQFVDPSVPFGLTFEVKRPPAESPEPETRPTAPPPAEEIADSEASEPGNVVSLDRFRKR